MSPSPTLPYMLQPDRLKQLNDHLVETTGCFAFLKTDQVLFSQAPGLWQDAYTIFSIGLYAVYHDYGCKFLRSLLLSDELCPDTLPKPGSHRAHLDTLNQSIRTNLAHGLLHASQRAALQRKLSNYYLPSGSYAHDPSDWPGYVNQLSEHQWMQITQRLTQDSDSLYQFLWSWGDEWAKEPGCLPGLRERFVSYTDFFANSFDDRVCRPILLEHGAKSFEVGLYTNKDSTYLKQWRQHLVQSYRGGKTQPEELYRELDRLIYQELTMPQHSSIDIAALFGF